AVASSVDAMATWIVVVPLAPSFVGPDTSSLADWYDAIAGPAVAEPTSASARASPAAPPAPSHLSFFMILPRVRSAAGEPYRASGRASTSRAGVGHRERYA